MICIDRCVCHSVSFKQILQTAKKEGLSSVEETKAVLSFGTKCRLCTPYVEKAFETGETVFHKVIKPSSTR